MLDTIRSELSKSIEPRVVSEILQSFLSVRQAYLTQDFEKCLVKGGKFSEAVMKAPKSPSFAERTVSKKKYT